MKRFRSEKGEVLVTALDRKTRKKSSSRTKAFDLIAATHPASRAAMQKRPADRRPRPEPPGSLFEENRALGRELEAARRQLAGFQHLGKVTEETAERSAAVQAESSELRGKLSAKDKLIERLREKAERTGSLLEEKRVLGEELEAARGWLGKLETRHAVLMGERDKLAAELKRREERLAQLRKEAAQGRASAAELKRREEQLAQLRKKAAQGRAGATELERLRGVARETQARLGAANVECLRLKTLVTLRDKLLEPLRARAARTTSLLGEKQALKSELEAAREGLAGLKAERDKLSTELVRLRRDAKEAAARLATGDAESSELKAQVSAKDELIKELRARAERASSLLDEYHTLERDLQAARERLAERESSLATLKTERDDVSAELARLRGAADETAARLAAVEAEAPELRAQASAKEQLAGQLRIAARNRADVAADSARLRVKLAEAEQRSEDAEARFVALLAERDDFETELLKRGEGMKGVVDEIRAQAGRLDSVLDENHRLRCELRKRPTKALRGAKETGRTTSSGDIAPNHL